MEDKGGQTGGAGRVVERGAAPASDTIPRSTGAEGGREGAGTGAEKRLRDALADALVGAQAAAAEGGRRKMARLGGNVAETREGCTR